MQIFRWSCEWKSTGGGSRLAFPAVKFGHFQVWNSKARQSNPSYFPTIKMTTSLCVTDLLNILLVDVPVIPAADEAYAAAAVPKKGAAIVLPPAGKFSCAARAYFWAGVSASIGIPMRLCPR